MKHYLLLMFCYSLSSSCMQSPDLTNQFINAIKAGDLQKVQTMLDAQPALQKSIREYSNFTAEPILKFAVRNPELKPRYMQITRYLVDHGAVINPHTLEQLQAYEALQKVLESKPAPSSKPITIPITKPARPLPATATPTSKPVITTSSTLIPADFDQLKELSNTKFNELKTYLATHDLSNITPAQKHEIIEGPISRLLTLGGGTPELVHAIRRVIALLTKNGFEMKAYLVDKYNRTQRGDFGARSGEVETLLNSAIKAKDFKQVKQLVEQEEADVNAAGTTRKSPLILAAETGAEDIAKYLYSKGARLFDNNLYENRVFKPQLQKWGIPVQ